MRLIIAFMLVMSAAASAQNLCADAEHYRWQAKGQAPGSHARADTVRLNDLLHTWPRLDIGKAEYCARRMPMEKNRIVVTGYLWRVKRSDDDGDYHLELTQSKSRFSDRCLIAEIPASYARVLAVLEKIVGGPVPNVKDFEKPIHLRLTGLPFWDGWHAGSERPHAHGRCNAAGIGVWEIHPVTRIARLEVGHPHSHSHSH